MGQEPQVPDCRVICLQVNSTQSKLIPARLLAAVGGNPTSTRKKLDFPSEVADMVSVPLLSAVTKPVESTEAMAGDDERQVTGRASEFPRESITVAWACQVPPMDVIVMVPAADSLIADTAAGGTPASESRARYCCELHPS